MNKDVIIRTLTQIEEIKTTPLQKNDQEEIHACEIELKKMLSQRPVNKKELTKETNRIRTIKEKLTRFTLR